MKMFLQCTITAMLVVCVSGASTPSAPTPTPSPSESSTQSPQTLDIFESAIFLCGSRVFDQDTLDMLFPPSDASVPNIVNETLAGIVHNKSYSNFCGKLSVYVYCVREVMQNSQNEIDNKVKVYIDMDNFDAALDVYCNNNESIPSQFHCTKRAVEQYSCQFGGMYGTMQYIALAVRIDLPKEQYCNGLRAAIQCRIDNQLRKCGANYADTMDLVYGLLTDKYCKP